ncbi:hypothetical protein ZYGR_0AK00860 [Zygosaccharomyces rouxii]|uniref:Uncharacterized protein n=1 Tax=Zygosaccharomyces rouxii TaxID=4956 RepID=A0A1Q3ACT6_ZYGRO|nr:hypothetical protein ZYGR_0AK00860 [Zygosaccharomyces rouxii]
MRRAFSNLSSKLLKSESDELKSTIQFLTRASKRPSLTSLLDADSGQNHEERVLKVLNSTLPEVDSQKRRVQTHYDILFSQLKDIARQSSQKPLQNGLDSSEKLYNYLMLQQYMGKLQTVPQMARIVLSKNFQDFDKLWENITMFDAKQQLHLSVLLYYRCGNPIIRQQFENQWLTNYGEMHISVQRLLWKCLTKRYRTSVELEYVVQATRQRIQSWSAHDEVVLYQSIYTKCHHLPTSRESLTKNQELFITTLRILAKHNVNKKDMLKIVKLSIENRLANETAEEKSVISIYQYRFIRALDLAVQDVYSACEGKKYSSELQDELQKVLASVNDEEQDIKSQMSLRFI